MNLELKDKLLLTIYYLGKMAEGGFATKGDSLITPKGFDRAIDLIEKGAKITKEEMKICLYSLRCIPTNQLDSFCHIMFDIQKNGLQSIMEKSKLL